MCKCVVDIWVHVDLQISFGNLGALAKSKMQRMGITKNRSIEFYFRRGFCLLHHFQNYKQREEGGLKLGGNGLRVKEALYTPN